MKPSASIVRVHQHPPGLDELARRVGLDHLAVDDDVGHTRRPRISSLGAGAVGAAGAQVVLDAAAVAVALGPLRLGDRVPDRLGRRLDVDPVDLGRARRRSCVVMPFPPARVLRSTSADTWRSVYLSIQRSWISRIGTGFRKCSFSRPDRRVTTSPASSSTRRCFITPKRVISSSDSSSVSVRPSRSKSRSSRKRRVGSASALNTRSSSVTTPRIGDQMVTCQARPHGPASERQRRLGEEWVRTAPRHHECRLDGL